MTSIEHSHELRGVTRLHADVVIVGSGAGGAMAASELSRQGARVVVLEQGPAVGVQHESATASKSFADQIVDCTADRAIRVLRGSCVGGSTAHSLALLKRTPESILENWAREHAVSGLSPEELEPIFESVERDLCVTDIGESDRNANNRMLELGARELGWRAGPLRHSRSDCRGSGLCALGCPFDAARNAANVLIPGALSRGARVITGAEVRRVLHDNGRVHGVSAMLACETPRELVVDADAVVLSASAVGSVAVALRSRLPDPHGQLGRELRLHPCVNVAGWFEERIEIWKGIPQSYECTEWLEFDGSNRKRIWITPACQPPVGTAVLLPVFGNERRDWMNLYPHLAVLSAMVRDETSGRVSIRDARPFLDYRLTAADAEQLARGVRACAELLFAAGARQVLVPTARPIVLRDAREAAMLQDALVRPDALPLMAMHPMGTLRLGDDPGRAVVKSTGEHHQVRGLFVMDGSLFPTSLGVPPQLSIYGVVRRLAGHVIDRLGTY